MPQSEAQESPQSEAQESPPETMAAVGRLLAAGEVAEGFGMLQALVEREPDHAGALNWLAILYSLQGRNDEALSSIERAAAVAPENADVQTNLGNILLDFGKYAPAIEAYRRAVATDPYAYAALSNLGALMRAYDLNEDAEVLLRRAIQIAPKHGQAHFNLCRVLATRGDHQAAVRHALIASENMPKGMISIHSLAAAHILNSDREKAVALVREWVEAAPEDAAARHVLAAVEGGTPPARASDAYVEDVFDGFAASFDSKLAFLEYRAPQLMGDVLRTFAQQGGPRLRILDAGCGTGLCGTHAKPYAAYLAGVDLSEGMLRRALRTRLYDELFKGELTAFLAAVNEPFDIVLSADTLCYFGALEGFASAAAKALHPGGLLAFTVEAANSPDAGYTLSPSGRYQHGEAYLRKVLGDAGFEPAQLSSEKLRMELGEPVIGHLVVARRI